MAKPHTLEIVPAVEPIDPALKKLLPELAEQIRATHESARRHAKLAIAFAVRQGHLCDQAKAELPHGKFEKWLDAHGIGKMTAHRDRLLAKSNTMLLLGAEELTAPNFMERIESDQAYRTELASRVHEVAGEATVTELMKDLGIIKPAANVDEETGKRIHHEPKKKKLTADQMAKQNRAAAKDRITRTLIDLKDAIADKESRRWLEPKDWIDLRKLTGDRLKQISAIADKAAAATAKGSRA